MNGRDAMRAAEDTKLERAVGIVLRTGVIVSSVCLAIGLLLEIVGYGAAARVLLNVGLVVLIATPACRVITSIAEYFLVRDWVFVGLTIVVLLELLGSLIAATR